MIKVAIIGCGAIADQHAVQIGRIKDCRLVGVCDREPLMAQQLAERFRVPAAFEDPEEMLAKLRPDVVHITTPPASHFALACLCLEAGCNVYVEKPFTLNTTEAERLIALAIAKRLRVTVGHNLQYSPEALTMRRLIEAGILGQRLIHIESLQCFSHSDPVYGKTVLGDDSHWVRQLPGSLLHNLISHGIGRMVEFLDTREVAVRARAFTSRFLKDLKQESICDELRVMMWDANDVTAYFTFSTGFGVPVNELRLYGTSGSIVIDVFNRSVVAASPLGYKSFMRYFLAPLKAAIAHANNTPRNIMAFLRQEFHEAAGMYNLMRAFYKCVSEGGDPPIPYREIHATSVIMDKIFQQMSVVSQCSIDDAEHAKLD